MPGFIIKTDKIRFIIFDSSKGNIAKTKERETGFEPATFSLEG